MDLNTSRVRYKDGRDETFGFIFFCGRIMKEYPILCDRWNVTKKKKGIHNPIKKRQINWY